MKWLLIPLLWLLAIGLAIAVMWRFWRGENIVLRGKWSPRVIRMVAIVLVILGFGAEKGDANPIDVNKYKSNNTLDADRKLPDGVTEEAIKNWLMLHQAEGMWARFKQDYTRVMLLKDKPTNAELQSVKKYSRNLTPRFASVVNEEIDAKLNGKETPRLSAREMILVLDDLEKIGTFDHWLNAYLWRRTAAGLDADRKEQIEVFRRLQQHARLTNTLIRAQDRVKPLVLAPQAWRSKKGPPSGWDPLGKVQKTDEVLAAAKILHSSSDLGTWERDGLVLLTPAFGSDAPTLVRAGQKLEVSKGETIRFHRLDLLETPADKAVTLEHGWIGAIPLPKDKLITIWDLPQYLPKEAKAKIQEMVEAALKGDEKAIIRLEQSLPLAHPDIRAGLANSPRAKGAAGLRLILSLFDDAVMPALKVEKGDLTDAFEEVRSIR